MRLLIAIHRFKSTYYFLKNSIRVAVVTGTCPGTGFDANHVRTQSRGNASAVRSASKLLCSAVRGIAALPATVQQTNDVFKPAETAAFRPGLVDPNNKP